ncbi:hypothetical protein [Streptomyces pratensis]|uniref:hypothetical protein n=1 Tax=Streptomyces pratensis TaxID=1169025 RepID=UPI0030164A8B
MSAAPAPRPRDAKRQQPAEQLPKEPKPKPVLVFDDPLDRRSADDTDQGWGERAPASGGAADLSRFLDEKPPHHI